MTLKHREQICNGSTGCKRVAAGIPAPSTVGRMRYIYDAPDRLAALLSTVLRPPRSQLPQLCPNFGHCRNCTPL